MQRTKENPSQSNAGLKTEVPQYAHGIILVLPSDTGIDHVFT
jgi:hypothetical protein